MVIALLASCLAEEAPRPAFTVLDLRVTFGPEGLVAAEGGSEIGLALAAWGREGQLT